MKVIPYLLTGATLVGSAWSFVVKWCGWENAHFLAAPSAVATFGVLYFCVDQWLWKPKVFGLSISSIPDLEGVWTVVIKPNPEPGEQPRTIRGTAHIKQTWTEIQIQVDAENGTAESLLGALDVKGAKSTLAYQYRYVPKGDAPENKHEHHGTATLTIDRDAQNMEGPFYTGRGRRNIGHASFTREPPRQ